MTPTRIPAPCLVAMLALCLVAALAPIAGPAADHHAAPVPASVGDDGTPAVTGPQGTLPGRVAAGGSLPGDGDTPAGHPGPLLDMLLPALPGVVETGPSGTAVVRSATAGLDPGHGSPTDPRGPPRA